jgi:hypothetical protein
MEIATRQREVGVTERLPNMFHGMYALFKQYNPCSLAHE